jgi:signal transduction histidine kinase
VTRGSFAIVRGKNLCHDYNWQMGHNEKVIMPLDGPGITVRAVISGESQLVDDVFKDSEYYDAINRREAQVRSELAVPVKTAGNVAAVINLESTAPSDFDYSDQRILEVFAEHVSSAMERIQQRDLMEEIQEKHVDDLIDGFRRVSSMVRHDMRNPLRTISIALDRMKKHPEETEKMMELVNRNIKFSNEIMEDWRQQTLQGNIRVTETNINELINESVQATHTPENIFMNVEVEEEIIFRLDANKIKRVLGNLTKNAIEAMPDGGTLSITSKMIDNMLEIVVSDTGIGISEQGISKLFTPFHTTKPNGIGLGLPYCKQAVEVHNGCIKVKSKKGEGTQFIIRLPRVEKVNPTEIPHDNIFNLAHPN